MRRGRFLRALIGASLLAAGAGAIAQPSLNSGTVMEAVERLRPGEFLWAPEIAPRGPMILVVSLATQRAVLYRNGIPVAITTVSTGRPGYRTPTGVFTILQKRAEHYSSLYNNAPMPFMQRLTWRGVALHGGALPGYPASHGCIRLPHEFARLLYGQTYVGMTVVVTDRMALPRLAPASALLGTGTRPRPPIARGFAWHPQRSSSGPVSIVISTAERRIVVLRNGVEIGSAAVEIDRPAERTSAYSLHALDSSGPRWLQLPLPGQPPAAGTAADPVASLRLPDAFRTALTGLLEPGTTLIVTHDRLSAATRGRVTVLDNDGEE